MSSKLATRLPVYVPKAETRVPCSRADSPPPFPTEISPILDAEGSGKPIESWSETFVQDNYPDKPAPGTASPIPPTPTGFGDKYLPPTLARNERLRLTLLWYHTQGIKEDKDLLHRLHEKVHLARQIVGWEFALTGVLDSHVYTRIATVGLPLAVLPRRETTCAHTINQTSLFMLPNMQEDWRFKNSPHVAIGGLRAYAGSALQLETEFGKVAFGSLCVASNSPQPPLSTTQQAALDSIAGMITTEIVAAGKLKRQRDRQLMSDLVTKLQTRLHDNSAEDLVLDVLRERYGGATISIQKSDSYEIALAGRPNIKYSDVDNGIWEDSEFVESQIAEFNHQRLDCSSQTVRAIVWKCSHFSTPTFVVVASSNMELIFDDLDSWFVERYAISVSTIQRERDLNKALKAKDQFLRGITHQLRTPIHGVLGSVELLAEELRSRNLLDESIEKIEVSRPFNASPFVNTIKTSGRDLMSIVDSMLKLNRWDDITHSPAVVTLRELKDMESAIMDEIYKTTPDSDLLGASIFFLHELPPECATMTIDIHLLKDCLNYLITNAMQNTRNEVVTVTISATSDKQTLLFDIEDTGCGIASEDHSRIFDAFEKIDSHSKGVGLGLTLASKLAVLMNGTVSLISSEPGKGSHFQMAFRTPLFAPTAIVAPSLLASLPHHPKTYTVHSTGECGHATYLRERFARYLDGQGLSYSKNDDTSLVILEYTEEKEKFRASFESVLPTQIAISLVPSGRKTDHLEHLAYEGRIIFVHGPFLSSHLDSILLKVNSLLALPMTANRAVVNDKADTIVFGHSLYVSQTTELKRPYGNATTAGYTEVRFEATLQIRNVPKVDMSMSPLPFALLVDDNPINLSILKLYCKKRKIPFVTAMDGEQAVKAFSDPSSSSPNLILMDLQMPVMDGIDATRQIRTLEKERGCPRSVILMVTGQDSQTDKTRSSEAGADGYFVKPVAMKVLDEGIKCYFPGFSQ